MTAPAAPPPLLRKATWLTADQEVAGPLQGYHHEAYAVPLPPDSPLNSAFRRAKLREPRPGLLWFDRRCFADEDLLLAALAGRVRRVPVVDMSQGFPVHGFIEGETLAARHPAKTSVPETYLTQLAELFEQLIAIKPGELSLERTCEARDRPADGDTTGFLHRLIHFTEHQVLLRHSDRYGGLFAALGVPIDALPWLRERAERHGLAERPFCLLHGDLHRENLVVAPDGRLWTIDWELAMAGDPLYDLATHLHLMDYPTPRDEAAAIDCWRRAVAANRPDCLNGWERDLPLYRDYKRAQSVYTDVIRAALTLGEAPAPADCRAAAERIRPVLARAGEALSMARVPGVREVAGAFVEWCGTGTGRANGPGRAR
ncbi:phosphotransferase [Streptomyces pathocidini]|uniref:Phosphotransferase n=1 Tax=Streptomyces pathocidini TaxID=1650571 RepID=A0ABW7UTF2_9ACTN|nr:aminoglycoside phosphotransferase family protein [Streptomyces pathocidini]